MVVSQYRGRMPTTGLRTMQRHGAVSVRRAVVPVTREAESKAESRLEDAEPGTPEEKGALFEDLVATGPGWDE